MEQARKGYCNQQWHNGDKRDKNGELVVLLVMVIWWFFSVEYVKEYNRRSYR